MLLHPVSFFGGGGVIPAVFCFQHLNWDKKVQSTGPRIQLENTLSRVLPCPILVAYRQPALGVETERTKKGC